MAGNYRSKGSNIVGQLSSTIRSGTRRRASAKAKAKTHKNRMTQIKEQGKQQRKTITHQKKAAIAVNKSKVRRVSKPSVATRAKTTRGKSSTRRRLPAKKKW